MRLFSLLFISLIGVVSVDASSFEEMIARKQTRTNIIDFEEGKRRLDKFRNFRYAGGYSFKFNLVNIPRRGCSCVSYSGILLGDWNDKGPILRIEFDNSKRLLIQSGFTPKIWVQNADDPVTELPYDKWFEPIFEDIDYTPFDFSLNFIFWDYANYEGPIKVKGRPAQKFLMKLPSELAKSNPHLGGAFLEMDNFYNVILGAELLDKNNDKVRAYSLLNFQEVKGEYIIKGIDVIDNATHDKTRFQIVAAAMSLLIQPQLFEPEGLAGWEATIDNSRYQYLK